MAKLNAMIAEKEKQFQEGCKGIDVQCNDTIAKIEAERISSKEILADQLVSDILK